MCIVTGAGLGLLALLSQIVPAWFYSSGEESMAWAIGLSLTGLLVMVIGCATACFCPGRRLRFILLNLIFLAAWFLAELIRVSQYPKTP
jgi:hypothetical protein